MTRLRAGKQRNRFRFPAGTRDLSFLENVKTGSEDHSASNSVGTGNPLSGVKRPGREARCLPVLKHYDNSTFSPCPSHTVRDVLALKLQSSFTASLYNSCTDVCLLYQSSSPASRHKFFRSDINLDQTARCHVLEVSNRHSHRAVNSKYVSVLVGVLYEDEMNALCKDHVRPSVHPPVRPPVFYLVIAAKQSLAFSQNFIQGVLCKRFFKKSGFC